MKHPDAKKFFTVSEQEQIRQAVEHAERVTSGEIATMIVDQSDRYLEAEVLGGVLVAALVALTLSVPLHYAAAWSHLPLDMSVWSFVPLVVVLYFPARLLFVKLPYLKHPFINKRRMVITVQERALRAFYEKGLYRTRDENGILIFISLLERKVWILGDRGVDSRIPPESWQVLASEISAGIGAGQGCASLCGVIGKCGRILEEQFPRKADDTNELPDDLLT